MKSLRLISVFIIAFSLICFVGCSKDDGESSGNDDLTGSWQASKEEIDAGGTGKLTLTPGSPVFINMVVDLNSDNTLTFESWNGTDKNAAGAEYQSGTGTWAVDGTAFSLDFDSEDMADIEGTYKLDGKNTLVISANMIISLLGENPVPVTITMTRV